jgi:hypothetical protein
MERGRIQVRDTRKIDIGPLRESAQMLASKGASTGNQEADGCGIFQGCWARGSYRCNVVVDRPRKFTCRIAVASGSPAPRAGL